MSFRKRRPLCNNDSSSAPVICGKTFYLCWRCCGAIVGLFLALFVNTISPIIYINYIWIPVLAVPAMIDYCMNKTALKKPSNKLRFCSGLLLGCSVAVIEILIWNNLCG